MSSLSKKDRKAKLCVAIKEFSDELLILVKMQTKMKYGSLMSKLKI